MSGPVARYWAELGFKVSRTELKKVDSHLKSIELKLKKFGKGLDSRLKLNIQIDKFSINDKKLRLTMGTALDKASKSVTFEISKFAVNDRNLRAALLGASRRMGNMPGTGGGIGGTTYINNKALSPQEWDRRQGVLNQNRMDQLAARQANQPAPRGRSVSGAAVGGGVAGGAGYGMMRSMYAPMFVGGLGMYGLGQVNQMNQEVISAQLTTKAVTEAAGLKGQGGPAFDWLKGQADRIGFSYMDSAQDYNNFLSNSLSAGVDLEGSQDIFLGFSEYARAMGITPARNKLVMGALSQMMGKGVLSMEEVRRQMAESMPGTMGVFAQAYSEMSGSGLEGQDALAAFYEAVPKGNVKSAEILPIVQRILREKAAPKLEIAMRTSQAEQARFKNQVANTSIAASDAGVESGFARLFKTMTTALKEGQERVEAMARAFDRLSQYVSFIMLIPQSFKRAFEGRDSYMADLLGEENIKIIKGFTEGLSDLTGELKTVLGSAIAGWGMIFGEFGDEMLTFASQLSNILLYTFKSLNQAMSGDLIGANNSLGAIRATLANKSPDEIKAIAEGKELMPSLKETASGFGSRFFNNTGIGKLYNWGSEALGMDAATGVAAMVTGPGFSYGKPALEGYWADHYKEQGIGASQQMMQSQNNTINIEPGAVVIQSQATDGEAVARDIESQLSTVIENTMPSFNRKE